MFVERKKREKTVQGRDPSRIAPVRDFSLFGCGQELVNNFKRYLV